jgi:gluconokinase
MFDLAMSDWDGEAMDVAGISRRLLCEPLPTATVVGGILVAVAAQLELPLGTPVVVGASDGPLANLGVGAVSPGVAAVSIGTSGALRVTLAEPAVDERATLFCYALSDRRWTAGGAINNGGAAFDWLAAAVAPELGPDRKHELLDEGAGRSACSDGLVMLPYLSGERAPLWDAQARGAFVGLTSRHRRPHFVRATVEEVCQQLALILESVRGAGHPVHEIRATGGFFQSAILRQVLADALGHAVTFLEADRGRALVPPCWACRRSE